MTNLLLCSMISMIYTNDLFTGYVFIEINTIAACAIVMVKESGETTVATIRYLIMSLLGSGLFLFGMAMLYGITDICSWRISRSLSCSGRHWKICRAADSHHWHDGPVHCGQSALFPFHSWLPERTVLRPLRPVPFCRGWCSRHILFC